jgi:ribosomal protein S18 acetylase RimI-like enzyme
MEPDSYWDYRHFLNIKNMHEIKYATENDLTKIAACHIAAFPDSFSSKLGVKFVSNMMKWYLSSTNKILFFIEDDKLVLGYCGGHLLDGIDGYGAASGMTQFGFNAALSAIMKRPWLIFHEELRKRYSFILRNILRKFKLKKDVPLSSTVTYHTDEPLTAGLVVIGVNPNLQQKGLGTFLQKEFERKSSSMGAMRLTLSVRTKNERAIKSYLRNGYSIKSTNETSHIMTKDLP